MQKNTNFFSKSIISSLRFSYAKVSVIFISLFIGALVSSAFLNISFDIESKLSNELKAYGANFIMYPAHDKNHISMKDYYAKLAQIPKEKLKVSNPYLYGFFSLGSNSAIVAGVNFESLKSIMPFIEVREGHFGNSVFHSNSVFVGVNLARNLELKVGELLTITNPKSTQSATLKIEGIISSGDEFDFILLAPLEIVQNLLDSQIDFDDIACDVTCSVDDESQNLANNSAFFTSENFNAFQLTPQSSQFILQSSPLASQNNDFLHYAELILYGKFDEVQEIGALLSDDSIIAKPIPQVSISEGVILDKIKSLMLLICITILLIASLSVNTSLSSIIFSRKKEVALHLSLGARKSQIAKLFGIEVLIIAMSASILGAFCGYLLANVLGFIIFDSSISFRILGVLCAILITLISAFLASFYPIKKALNINIITNLKGE